MKVFKWTILLGVLCALAIGCGDDGGTTDEGNDTGTDAPDAGDDTTDEGNDTGTGDPVVEEGAIVADETGWIAGDANAWGVQGAWYTYDDNSSCDPDDATVCGDSTITGSVSATGGYCAEGVATSVRTSAVSGDTLYSVYWGAGIGFNLCLDPGASDSEDDDIKGTISNCTLADLSNVIGVRLTVTGEMPTELRVTFLEEGRDESTYINAVAVGNDIGVSAEYLFADADVGYDSSADPIDPTKIVALQFQVPSGTGDDVPFGFCIENLQLITQ